MATKLYFNVMDYAISRFVFNCSNEAEFECLCDIECWIMQFKSFGWLSHHGISSTTPFSANMVTVKLGRFTGIQNLWTFFGKTINFTCVYNVRFTLHSPKNCFTHQIPTLPPTQVQPNRTKYGKQEAGNLRV